MNDSPERIVETSKADGSMALAAPGAPSHMTEDAFRQTWDMLGERFPGLQVACAGK